MVAVNQLRVCPDGSFVLNDYRVVDEHLKLRTVDERECHYRKGSQERRQLSDSEMATHSALRTVVARWFEDKVKNRSSSYPAGLHCLGDKRE
jgi:hypothetical protein